MGAFVFSKKSSSLIEIKNPDLRVRIFNCSHHRLKILAPKTSDSTNKTRKIKNNTFAMDAAPAAIPPNPNNAATSAITRNVIVQRNIKLGFNVKNLIVRNI